MCLSPRMPGRQVVCFPVPIKAHQRGSRQGIINSTEPRSVVGVDEVRGQENCCRQTEVMQNRKGDAVVVLKAVIKGERNDWASASRIDRSWNFAQRNDLAMLLQIKHLFLEAPLLDKAPIRDRKRFLGNGVIHQDGGAVP